MIKHQQTQFAGALLSLMWLVLCIAVFLYLPGRVSYVHWANLASWPLLAAKIERIQPLTFTINLFQSIAGIAIFVFASTLTGLGILRLLRANHGSGQADSTFTHLAYWTTAALVGHGIFSLIFMTLAIYGWLTPWCVGMVLLLGTLSGLGMARGVDLSHLIKAGKIFKKSSNKVNNVIFGLAICILFFSLFYSSSRLSYDSVAVYFSNAKLTALTGKIQYFTNDSFVVSIFHTAIEFSAIMQIFGDHTARMFSWVSGLAIIVFSTALGERAGISRQAGKYLFLLLLTSTAFLDLMGDGKVDLISFLPAIAAIYWMTIESESQPSNKSLLLLIGFLISLAMAARPFNIILVGAFTCLYYLLKAFLGQEHYGVPQYKRLANSLLWIGIGVVPLAAYHLYANWSLLGDPFAMISNTMKVDSSKWQWAFDRDQITLIRLLYPLAVTFLNTPQSLGTISPLFIAFLPSLLLEKIRKEITISKELRILLVVSLVILLCWVFILFTVFEIRYVIFLWIIFFMPLAEIMARALEDENRLLKDISNGAVVILLFFLAWRTIYISLDTYSPLDEQGNPQCSDSRFCEYLGPINKIASTGDRVLTLSAFRYYLRTDLFACSTKHDEYTVLQEMTARGPEAFWEEVYRQGYKYIAYENDYTTRHLQFEIIPSPDNTPKWVDLEPISGKPGDLQIAYKINVSNPPIESKKNCLKNSSGVWEVHSSIP